MTGTANENENSAAPNKSGWNKVTAISLGWRQGWGVAWNVAAPNQSMDPPEEQAEVKKNCPWSSKAKFTKDFLLHFDGAFLF